MQKEFGFPVRRQKYHKKDLPVLNRVLFWLSFVAINLWLFTLSGIETSLLSLGLIYLVDAIVILVLAYVIFPYLYFLRNNFSFFLLSVLLALSSIGVKMLVLHYDPEFASASNIKTMPFVVHAQVMIAFLYYAISLIWASLRFKRKEVLHLDRQLTSRELDYLHKEINPHTLFNFLNGLHVLISTDREKAKSLLEALSDVLRYHTYTNANTKVPLKDEVENCVNFLDLYKLKTPKFDYKITKNGDFNNLNIYPFIYLPLVENACKYGVASQKSSLVEINLDVLEDSIIFEIENSKVNVERDAKSGGVGLSNLKKRLNLLYGNDYRLVISDNTNKYNVKLVLTKI